MKTPNRNGQKMCVHVICKPNKMNITCVKQEPEPEQVSQQQCHTQNQHQKSPTKMKKNNDHNNCLQHDDNKNKSKINNNLKNKKNLQKTNKTKMSQWNIESPPTNQQQQLYINGRKKPTTKTTNCTNK